MRSTLLLLALLWAPLVAAQQKLPQNPAEAVARQYRFAPALEGFRLRVSTPAPDPSEGVATTWTSDRDPSVRFDVYLYRARTARVENVALREGMAAFLGEIGDMERTGHYRLLAHDDAAKAITIDAIKPAWRGSEYALRFASSHGEFESYTLLFYRRGHFVKLRASAPLGSLSARALHEESRKLMTRFLAAFEVVEPFGPMCGPPEFAEVPAGDARAGTFNADDSVYFLAAGLGKKEAAEAMGAAMSESIVRAANAKCLGDDVRIERRAE